MAIIVHVDGGSRGNPGPAGCGVVVQRDDGQLLFEAAYYLGEETNNVAEYYGLIHALNYVQQLDAADLRVFADSELLVKQITGQYRVKNPRLQELFAQAQMLLLKLPRWQIQHVRREGNKRADELANLAMDRRRNTVVFDAAGQPPETSAAAETDVTTNDSPAQEAEATEPAATPRAVRVRVIRAPGAACPAQDEQPREFTIEAVLPAGLCVHAAHAILPTVLAVQSAAANEYAAIPDMSVRCSNPECGAVFQISPLRPGNGVKRS